MKGLTESRVQAVIARHFGVTPSEVRPDAVFVEELKGDALDLVEVLYAIEAEFDVVIPRTVRDTLVTVRSIISWLNSEATPFTR